MSEKKTNKTENSKEIVEKMIQAIEFIPRDISKISMMAMIAPELLQSPQIIQGFDKQELKYKLKFGFERIIKAAQESIKDCEEAIKEIENPKEVSK